MGKLYFRYGVMGSAKSATLLTQKFAFEQAGFNVCVLKPETDTRDIGIIKSRIEGLSCDCITVSQEQNLYELINGFFKQNDIIKWVLIDECQFLTEKQIDELREICDATNINIMGYGLRTDFQTHLFEGSKRLMEIADTMEEIKFSCPFCGKKATVNARFNKKTNKVITEGRQIMMGGDESYIPMCTKCYKKYR